MSKTVDQRVVEMQFDNNNFEKNVKTSLSTIDKLKQSLDFSKSGESLEKLNNPNLLSGFVSAVQSVTNKFSRLEIAAITAISNIVNKAVDAGLRIARSLTVEPISQGFQEYELKLGSIQTIMMSTGESMETVNKYLEELNTYADRTIYSFSDMTANIGKFTNAGVDLETAVKAIQGISNAAAVSGANAGDASRAMYNFAQALSSGYVKLIDWKSIETANMATVEFKQQLIDTAVELGTLSKQADGTYKVITKGATGSGMKETMSATKNFNDSLSYQWMTTEVLTKALGKYSDETTEIGKKAYAAAQDVKTFTQLIDTLKEAVGSGWAQTFEIIFGNFNEAKQLWTNINVAISGIVDAMSDARNEVLRFWKALGGRTDMLTGFRNIWETVSGAVTTFKDTFDEVFGYGQMTTAEMHKAIEQLKKDNAADLIEDYAEALKKLNSGEASIDEAFGLRGEYRLAYLREYTELIKSQTNPIEQLGKALADASEKFKKFTDRFNIKKYKDGIEELNKSIPQLFLQLKKAKQEGNVTAIETLEEKLNELTSRRDAYKDFFDRLSRIGDNFKTFFAGISSVAKAIATIVSNIFKTSSPIFSVLDNSLFSVLELISKVAAAVGTALTKFSEWAVSAELLTNIFKPLASIMDVISRLIGNLVDGASKLYNNAKEFFTNSDFMDKLSENLKSIGETLKGVFTTKNMAILTTGFENLMETIFTFAKNFVKGGLAISLGASLKGLFDVFSKVPKDASGFIKAFPEALQKLVSSGEDDAPGILDKLKDSLESFQNALSGVKLLNIAISIGILAVALTALSKVEPANLAKGLGALAVEMLLLKKAIEGLSKIKMEDGTDLKKTAASLIPFAAAILLLSVALSMLAKAEPAKLLVATVSIAAIMEMLALVAKQLSSIDKARLTKGMGGLIAFAIAINLLVAPVKKLAEMDVPQLARGIISVSALMLALVVAAKILNGISIDYKSSVIILALSASMVVLALAAKMFAAIEPEPLIKAGVAMTALLTIMTMFAAILSEVKGRAVVGAAAMVVLAGAMVIVAKAVDMLGSLDTMTLVNGGTALVAFLGAMTVALMALGAIGAAKTLAGAASLMAVALALTVLVVPLKMLAGMKMEAATNALIILVGALGMLHVAAIFMGPVLPIMAGLAGTIALLGVACLGVGAGLLAFSAGLTALSVSGVAAIDGLTVMISAIFEAIIKALPRLFEYLVDGVGIVISAVLRNVSQFVVDLGPLLDTVLKLITDRGPAFIEAALSILNTLLQNLITYAPIYGEAAVAIVVGFIDGFANGIDQYGPQLIQAIDNLLWSLFAVILNMLGMDVTGAEAAEMVAIGQGTVNGFISGINDQAQAVWDAGANLLKGFWDGLKSLASDVWDWCKDFAQSIIDVYGDEFDMHSPSKVFKRIGMYVDEGLAEGLDSYASVVEASAVKTADSAITSMSRAIATIPELLDNNIDYEPTIRPIMDLSNIQNGANTIGGLMSGFAINGSYNLARNASNYNSSSAQSTRPVANITLNAKTINRAEVDYLMNRANNVLLESAISFKG